MYQTLTQQNKDLLQNSRNNNPINPVVVGVNQGQAMPRLNSVALSSRPQIVQQPTQSQYNSSGNGLSSILEGGVSLMNGLGGLFGKDKTTTIPETDGDYDESIIPDRENTSGGDLVSNGSKIWNLYKTFGNSAGNSAASSTAGSSMGGYGGLIGGALNGLGSFAKDGDYKDGLQGIFSVDSENQSDVSQALSGTVNGAQMGASFGGPWGALIGGVLGLGSSFLDDI